MVAIWFSVERCWESAAENDEVDMLVVWRAARGNCRRGKGKISSDEAEPEVRPAAAGFFLFPAGARRRGGEAATRSSGLEPLLGGDALEDPEMPSGPPNGHQKRAMFQLYWQHRVIWWHVWVKLISYRSRCLHRVNHLLSDQRIRDGHDPRSRSR